jgi:DNA-binding MarR family transcriptional regulator
MFGQKSSPTVFHELTRKGAVFSLSRAIVQGLELARKQLAVVDPNLTVHAEALLIQFVSAWEQAPPEQKWSFGISPGAGHLLAVYHPGFTDGVTGTSWEFIGELEAAGLIVKQADPPLYAQYRIYYSLTTRGRSFALTKMRLPKAPSGPRLFIVHGRDEATKWEVKNYLQNRLQLPEPIVLHEQANRGRTIIEKFEESAADVDGAVVLLTPDDQWQVDGSNEELRRARQNVIFELGYFYGRFERRSGRVLLLYKKPLDLPSDISGIVYIDISQGVEQAGEQLRRELTD